MLDLPFFVTALFVVSFCFTGLLVWIVAKAFFRRRWPTVPGKILTASVVEYPSIPMGDLDSTEGFKSSGPLFVPTVSYAYEVNGKAYESKAVERLWSWGKADRAQADGIMTQWAPGTIVPVYYRPSQPLDAYLIRRKFPRFSAILLGLSLVPLWWTARLFWAFAA